MNGCDICKSVAKSASLTKIETDWNGTYKMVCAACIEERGEYAIACRFDKPRGLQDESYAVRAF